VLEDALDLGGRFGSLVGHLHQAGVIADQDKLDLALQAQGIDPAMHRYLFSYVLGEVMHQRSGHAGRLVHSR
jgi:hypothetical protein